MNTPNPLVPQGTFAARGKSNFFLKVVMVLAVHAVIIGGALLQGCKDTNSVPPPAATDNSASTNMDTNLPPISSSTMSNAAVTPQTPMTQPVMSQTPAPMTPMQPAPSPTPVAPMTDGGHEVIIASGDTLGAIARKNSVSVKALLEANPGVNPRKLKVGQKIQLPSSASAVNSTPNAGSPEMASVGGDGSTYTVKSGDTLGKIARANHTTYKKLMSLNDMKTTSIRVGQKLKLPGSSNSAAPDTQTPAMTGAPASMPATAPGAMPATAPVSTTASNQ